MNPVGPSDADPAGPPPARVAAPAAAGQGGFHDAGFTPTLDLERDAELLARLESRLGALHARARLSIEGDHADRMFRRARNILHPENWYSFPSLIRFGLRATGLYPRAVRNARTLTTVHNPLRLDGLAEGLRGLRLLHLSDLHIDVSVESAHAILAAVRDVDYDLCVLTGDYRFHTTGDVGATLRGMERLRASLGGDVYAVLGNHDSVRMLPDLEDMGIRVLMNERVEIERNGARLHLAGIDDAHFFRVQNFEKALTGIPRGEPTVLLSHTPEVYRQAAHYGVDVLLCGHTHGGQLCLPGGVPVLLDARIPRRLARGPWRQNGMIGYTSPGAGTSIAEVRLNCPAEITLHTLL